jgi:hypothetical protein
MTAKERSVIATPVQADLDFEIAMALAEQYAGEYDPVTTSKQAPWRAKGPARPGQRNDLMRYGIVPRKTMSAAQAYDEICVAMASVRLDRVAS